MPTLNGRRIAKLWDKDPHCFYCGTRTVKAQSGEIRTLPDTATFDHLYNRLRPERKDPQKSWHGVLACRQCNLDKGRQEFLSVYRNGKGQSLYQLCNK
jgi:5-methylcytosine-specific restriction endonuclease McrA